MKRLIDNSIYHGLGITVFSLYLIASVSCLPSHCGDCGDKFCTETEQNRGTCEECDLFYELFSGNFQVEEISEEEFQNVCRKGLGEESVSCATESATFYLDCLEEGGNEETCKDDAEVVGNACLETQKNDCSLSCTESTTNTYTECMDTGLSTQEECTELANNSIEECLSSCMSGCQDDCLNSTIINAKNCSETDAECFEEALSEYQDCESSCSDFNANVFVGTNPATTSVHCPPLGTCELTFSNVTHEGIVWSARGRSQPIDPIPGFNILGDTSFFIIVEGITSEDEEVTLTVPLPEPIPEDPAILRVDDETGESQIFYLIVDVNDNTATLNLPLEELNALNEFYIVDSLQSNLFIVVDGFHGIEGEESQFGYTRTSIEPFDTTEEAIRNHLDHFDGDQKTEAHVTFINHHDPDSSDGGPYWASFSNSFPGEENGEIDQNFSVTYKGEFEVPEGGDDYYTFVLHTSGAAALRIKNKPVNFHGPGIEVFGGDTAVQPEISCDSNLAVSYFLTAGTYHFETFCAFSENDGAPYCLVQTAKSIVAFEIFPNVFEGPGNWALVNQEIPESSPQLPFAPNGHVSKIYFPVADTAITSLSQAESLLENAETQLTTNEFSQIFASVNWSDAEPCWGIDWPLDLDDGSDNDNFIVTFNIATVFPEAGKLFFEFFHSDGGKIKVGGASNIEILSSDRDLATVDADTVLFEGLTKNSKVLFSADVQEGEHDIEIVTFHNLLGAFGRLRVTNEGGLPSTTLAGATPDHWGGLLLASPDVGGTVIDPEEGGTLTDDESEFILEIDPLSFVGDLGITFWMDPPPKPVKQRWALANGDEFERVAARDFRPDGFQFTKPATLTINSPIIDLPFGIASRGFIGKVIDDSTILSLPTIFNEASNQYTAEINSFSIYALFIPSDDDQDGTPNNFSDIIDACPSSDLSPTVTIGNCLIENTVNTEGCSLQDRLELGEDLSHLCTEICNDGIDNDNDFAVDCGDSDCFASPPCSTCQVSISGPTELEVNDEISLIADTSEIDLGVGIRYNWNIVEGSGTIIGLNNLEEVLIRCDGLGDILVELTLEAANCETLTKASFTLDCTGLPGGLQMPGDCNQDSKFDLTDTICILSHLFLGNPAILPCENGVTTDPANVIILDSNGDSNVDLSDAIHMLGYQFGTCFQGPPCPPHVQGINCIFVPGCPDACGQ